MNTQHFHHGRHPMVRSALTDFYRIERLIMGVSPKSRLIPTRFGRRRGGARTGKLTINVNNPRELLGKLYGRKYFQGFKVECPDETTATVTYELLKEVLQWGS